MPLKQSQIQKTKRQTKSKTRDIPSARFFEFPVKCQTVEKIEEQIVGNVKKIAVLRANALGDFIFILPALRLTYPEAEIILLGKPWHRDLAKPRRAPINIRLFTTELLSVFQQVL